LVTIDRELATGNWKLETGNAPEPLDSASRLTSDNEAVLHTLTRGDLRLEGQFQWGSNYTFLVTAIGPLGKIRAVYKPRQGERPLWDFPYGTLAAREVAAYRTSSALGWNLVPPTVLRPDGPAGPGSLQLFLDIDPERHVFTFGHEDRQRLRPTVAFDVLINNADRKGGHILLAPDGHIWLIDHGISFHEDDKLRTVLWEFAGEAIPADILSDLERFTRALTEGGLDETYANLLTVGETQAMARRAERLLADGVFPAPGPGRPYPWPLV
jgi:uncharacterized repeat protein (TIGR03843 family)